MPATRPIAARFAEKYRVDDAGCWIWVGKSDRTKMNYGKIHEGPGSRRWLKAHRVSYELHCGEIPEGMQVMHKCDRPLCVNPAHLSLGTHADNMKDMAAKRRGKSGGAKGEELPQSKLTEDAVRDIKRKALRQREYAEKYGIHQVTVSDIWTGKSWSHVSP
jgi:predicted XRE-type DNA-binding protein